MKLKIIKADFHRNGIGGEGFYAILFEDLDEKLKMVASLFDKPGYCAVYGIGLLGKGNIAFGSNSWRGDQYEYELRPLLKEYIEKHGTNRLGPFGFPRKLE